MERADGLLFLQTLKGSVLRIEEQIQRFLPEECGMQRTIFEACNYSVQNGGKRIRPLLMESAWFLCRLSEEGGVCKELSPEALFSRYKEEYETVLSPFLAAIEMIHSSSLVHDDLPCMDNDRMRRGKLSTWAKFGEDMGTLTGDALMIYAFETASRAAEHAPEACAGRILRAIRILAEKTGIYGMIGGQTVDVQLTGQQPSEEQLRFIYELKTGALLEASMMIGAVLAGAGEETAEQLRRAAAELGMAFQIQDDVLDETGSEEVLGKPVGSDERNRKTTYVSLYGQEQARKEVARLTECAVSAIGEIADYPFLKELCIWLIHREN